LDMPKRLDTHLVVEAFTDLYACRGESHGSWCMRLLVSTKFWSMGIGLVLLLTEIGWSIFAPPERT
jgi:hypothetical protein